MTAIDLYAYLQAVPDLLQKAISARGAAPDPGPDQWLDRGPDQWPDKWPDPWIMTRDAPAIIASLDPGAGYCETAHGVYVHDSATVEPGSVLKGPAIIGPRAFVAAGAYLRGGVFLDEDVIVGPYCELKTVFMLKGSKIAHLSFVGDSLIGARANIEAGAVIANYRNERDDKIIRIALDGGVIDTGVDKFGALVGDDARIGANAVIAPGAVFKPRTIIRRAALIDQHPDGAAGDAIAG